MLYPSILYNASDQRHPRGEPSPKKEGGELGGKVSDLEAQLAFFKKQLFGTGKNEKQDKAQLLLKLGQLEAQLAEMKTETVSYERNKASKPRQPTSELFEHLPVRETIEIIPPEVKRDPSLYERIGEETTFEVDIIQPQKAPKRLIVRPKYRHLLDHPTALGGPSNEAARNGWVRFRWADLLRRPLQICPPSSALSARTDVEALGRTNVS